HVAAVRTARDDAGYQVRRVFGLAFALDGIGVIFAGAEEHEPDEGDESRDHDQTALHPCHGFSRQYRSSCDTAGRTQCRPSWARSRFFMSSRVYSSFCCTTFSLTAASTAMVCASAACLRYRDESRSTASSATATFS